MKKHKSCGIISYGKIFEWPESEICKDCSFAKIHKFPGSTDIKYKCENTKVCRRQKS
jgi:hypothetical protein